MDISDIAISFVGCIILVYLIYVIFAELKQVLIHKKAEMYYLSQVTEINEDYKEKIHNISHFLKVIGEMAVEGQNEEIYDLVKELDESIGKNVTITYSNNKILNALLAENATKAKKYEVIFDVYVEPGTNLEHISDIDLISMLGNLLDNAITAASKKGNNSLVKVRIFMQKDGKLYIVKIINDFAEEPVKKDGKLLSTKKEDGLHGIGISSVKRNVQKYNGYLEYYIEDGQFISVLVIPVDTVKTS